MLHEFNHNGRELYRDSSVDIVNHYGLNVPGIEFRCGRYFPHPSKPALGPTQSTIVGTRSFPGLKRQGLGVEYTPNLAPREKKE
jgi:hypothetical protein